MHLLVTNLGISLILVILWDAFSTIVLPRTVAFFRPSSQFFRGAWNLWANIGTMVRDPYRRQTFYAVFGPFSVLLLMLFWGVGLIIAFALLHWGLRSVILTNHPGHYGSLGTLLYFSGTTFLTLGMGDVTALNPLGRVFIVLEAMTGFVSLAVVVGYFPLLDQAFSQREARLTLFGLRCGSPQSGVRILERFGKAEDRGKLEKILSDTESWIAELLQNQLSHPVLAYYRSQHLGQSWLISLTAFLDLCALLQIPADHPLASQVKTSFRMALYAMVEMSRALKMAPLRPRVDRLSGEDFEKIRASLEKVGLFFPPSPEAETKLRELRHLYEPFALSMGKELKIALPVWVLPEEIPETLEDFGKKAW